MRTLILFVALMPLVACSAPDAGFPSLLPRPIESRDDVEPVRPDPVVVPDSALDAKIAEQRTLADAAARRFQAAAVEAEARVAVARGVPAGSEAWVAAQTALANLSPIRGETLEIATTLEQAAIARGEAGTASYPALDAAIADIGARAVAQADRINALEAALGN